MTTRRQRTHYTIIIVLASVSLGASITHPSMATVLTAILQTLLLSLYIPRIVGEAP